MEDVESVLDRFRGRIGLSKDPSDLMPGDSSSSVSGTPLLCSIDGLGVDLRDSYPHSESAHVCTPHFRADSCADGSLRN